MKRFDEVRNLLMSLEADFDKFFGKGDKEAGTRIIQGMEKLEKMAQDIRLDVQER